MSRSTLRVVGVIPARFGASRFPGKPLARIAGKPMIQWVWEGARQSRLIDRMIVATDHSEIAEVIERVGGEVVMTEPDLPSGTDRVWAAVKSVDGDVILNIQGDEPLVGAELLDALVTPFLTRPDLHMATLARVLRVEDVNSLGVAKVVINKRSEAIYFSRCPIPFTRASFDDVPGVAMRHVGLYAFRKEFLREFCSTAPTLLEQAEGLEQLRALYMGTSILVIPTDAEAWGVDTPEDVEKIENLLKKRKG